MRNFLYPIVLISGLFAATDKVNLKLNDPIITKRSATCSKGGVIKTDDITIYAKNFDYKNDDGEHIVSASGNLLIAYTHYFIIGDSITYNFKEKRGVIKNAVGTVNNIITGGKELHIFEDGSLEIKGAFVTTSVLDPPLFNITSPLITIDNNTQAVAKTMVARINNVPFLWLPSYGTTLDPKYEKPPTIAYAVDAENNQIPAIYLRYKMYDNDFLQAYARLEYRFLSFDEKISQYQSRRWYDGLGGALDVDMTSENKKFTLQSRNFVTYNIWPLDINPNIVGLRYRIQGIYKGETEDGKIETKVQWDKLSDRFIRANFKSRRDWEINTLETSEAYVKYRTDPAYVSLYAKPRLNEYRGFKQELPNFEIAAQPVELFGTKLCFEQTYEAAYLRYLYAEELRGALDDFSSGRLSTIYNLYRPFHLGGCILTPRVGFDGIFYTNNQKNETSYQAVATYGGDLSWEFYESYSSFDHYVKPFVTYNGLTAPTSDNLNHFILGIADGYARYNEIIYGINNEIYFHRFDAAKPTFAFNIRGISFIGTKSFTKGIAKGDIEFLWHYPRAELSAIFGWNFQKNQYDYAHVRFGWTINDYFAVSTEFRTRGKYWWRKCRHQNYRVDTLRTINELEQTPLSNARYCVVSKAQLQLSPLWILQLENNVGKSQSYRDTQGQNIPGDNQFYVQTKGKLFMIVSNYLKVGIHGTFTNANKENVYGFIFESVM